MPQLANTRPSLTIDAQVQRQSDFRQRVVDVIRSRHEPVYAVLDASQSSAILRILHESGQHFDSLYQGQAAIDFESVAPYIVEIKTGSALLELMLTRGWGCGWGIFVAANLPFSDVRDILRRFMMIRLPNGSQGLFRFYDPAVIAAIFEVSTFSERQELFGGVSAIIVESETGDHLLTITDRETFVTVEPEV